jgi:ribonucleoside-diphosphate reductase alpha chain
MLTKIINHMNTSEIVWNMKYRYSSRGIHHDETIEDTFHPVATTTSQFENNIDLWRQEFFDAFVGFKLIPAGRILAGAGTNRNVSMINTFMMGVIPDSLEGVLSAFSETVLTLWQGGGIGCDFSSIRPKASRIKGVESLLAVLSLLWTCGIRCATRS